MSAAAPSSVPGGNSGTFDSLPPVKGPRRKISFRERSVLASESRVGIGPAVVVSICAHVAMFGGALAWAHWSAPRVVPEKPIVAKLVRLGKPRDEKLLPRLPTTPPVPPPVAVPVPVVAPPVDAPPPSPTAKPLPVVPPAPTARPETPEERQKRLMAAFNSLGAPTEGPTSKKPEELTGQKDGDAAGTSEDAAEGDRYLGLVVEALRRGYELPTTITARERMFLSCKLRLFISATGEIERFVIEQGSGNEQFDRAVEAKLQRTKLPPPPEAFTSRFGRSGVGFDFKP